MDLLFLGTGAADIAAPDTCECDNCAAVRARGMKSRRTFSSLLLDRSTLIDCGPTVPAQLDRYAQSVAPPGQLLFTHLHEDHADPTAIAELARRVEQQGAALGVSGGQEALAHLREAIDGTLPLTLQALQLFEPAKVGPWRVTALPARHMDNHPEAFVYLLEGDGRVLLYACDTGPLPDATEAFLDHRALDAVIMEATFGLKSQVDGIEDLDSNHLNFTLAAEQRERLLARGAAAPSTPWYATHLSLHHCPPHEEAEAWLSDHGMRLAWDGLAVAI